MITCVWIKWHESAFAAILMQGHYAGCGSERHVALNASIQTTLENLFVFIIICAHPVPPAPSFSLCTSCFQQLLRPSRMPSNLKDNLTCVAKFRMQRIQCLSLSLVLFFSYIFFPYLIKHIFYNWHSQPSVWIIIEPNQHCYCGEHYNQGMLEIEPLWFVFSALFKVWL